jgi:hypothetical protein
MFSIALAIVRLASLAVVVAGDHMTQSVDVPPGVARSQAAGRAQAWTVLVASIMTLGQRPLIGYVKSCLSTVRRPDAHDDRTHLSLVRVA